MLRSYVTLLALCLFELRHHAENNTSKTCNFVSKDEAFYHTKNDINYDQCILVERRELTGGRYNLSTK